jgi:hypothetical protein
MLSDKRVLYYKFAVSQKNMVWQEIKVNKDPTPEPHTFG